MVTIVYAIRQAKLPKVTERRKLRFQVRPVLRGQLGRVLAGQQAYLAMLASASDATKYAANSTGSGRRGPASHDTVVETAERAAHADQCRERLMLRSWPLWMTEDLGLAGSRTAQCRTPAWRCGCAPASH